MSFENPQIELSGIPRFEDLNFEPLEPKYRNLLLFNALISSLVCALIYGVLMYFFLNHLWWSAPIAILIFVWIWAEPLFAYPKMGVALRAHDIAYKHGIWWQSQTVMAFNRIQHMEISQGPIEKRMGLSHLQLYTAGGFGADLSVQGLTFEKAQEIRGFILEYKQNNP